LLFEHGSGPLAPRSGACVHHAHIHVLPLTAPVDRWMGEIGPVRQVGRLSPYELPDRLTFTDYLAYQDQDDLTFLVVEIRTRPPCQFIRRRLAEHLSLGDWRWESAFARGLPVVPRHSTDTFSVCSATAATH
jgi:hypothetical protein